VAVTPSREGPSRDAPSPAGIAQHLTEVHQRIELAARRAGRDPSSIRLTAVSKTFGAEAIVLAHASGQRVFGENYVQEIEEKASKLGALPELELRFIGNLQRRKVKTLLSCPLVTAIETVDDAALADEIEKRSSALGRTVEVMLQVNVGKEPQKSGCSADALGPLIDHVRVLPHLRLSGLMTVPPHTEDPEGARPFFRELRELARVHGLSELSMGMSHDLEVAVSEGATRVRIGTAIFGARVA
jgi:pyridoxal phosphate enzyme (YggS family)